MTGVNISVDGVCLEGDLGVPNEARGVVLFAHGSGSSRHCSRNRFVAGKLQESGLGTLLLDLLTEEEEEAERYSRHLRFDLPLLANRVIGAVDWLREQPDTRSFPIGLFGASTGAAAALMAADERPASVRAVVSRGGRPDLAGPALDGDLPPTLLIVGSLDTEVVALNQASYIRMKTPDKRIEFIPGATHLFEEPGALEGVAQLAAGWFARYLGREA